MTKMFKISSLVLAGALLLTVVAVPTASAVTIDELMAQIATLTAQLNALKGTTAATSATFTRDLTVGSKGDDVSALQQVLVDGGYLNIAAPTGYFGAMTKAALAKYQAENGIAPAIGYFGPKTRAAMSAVSTVPGTTPGTTPVGGITTPGVEGTLTVTANPTPGSGLTVREGDTKIQVLGLKLEAKLSDIAVQRVKVDLGSSTIFYNKLFKKMYVMDGSTVISEIDLNSSTVVKDGSTYYITLAGFSVIVPKNSSKVLYLAVDAQTSIDSTYDGNATYGLLLPADGVRGVDGAGLDQKGPATALSRRTVTIDSEAVVDAATMTVSKNTTSPAAQTVVANDGTSNNEKDKVTLLVFDVKGTKDVLTITDLNASVVMTGATGNATATTAYLMDGDTVVGSATVRTTDGMAYFTDIDVDVAADTTKTFTLKADMRSAGNTAVSFVASTTGSNLTVENTAGTAVTPTGSATGDAITVRKSGAEITIVGTPTITTINSGATTAGLSTTTATATFKVRVKAIGSQVLLGNIASSAPMLGTTTAFVLLYKDGASTATLSQTVASSTSVTFDEQTTTVSGNTATLAQDNTTDVTLVYTFEGRNKYTGAALGIGSYAVGIESLQWVGNAGAVSSTFMAGKSAWRTPAVSLTQ